VALSSFSLTNADELTFKSQFVFFSPEEEEEVTFLSLFSPLFPDDFPGAISTEIY
jgi:hypothetical protein